MARSETVYAGMVYRHFFGRLEIIPTVASRDTAVAAGGHCNGQVGI